MVACPMCQANLDMYQKDMAQKYKDDFQMPVVYFTQLLGLAMGLSPIQLMLDKHFTDPMPVLGSKIIDIKVPERAL